ncbi:MAG: type II toxin-antitoxin system VapC family toxin [Thermosynechococcaceae cyanobacterium]
MIVDTSAVMAIVMQEPGWEKLYDQAVEASALIMSCGTLQELLIVALRKNILAEVETLLSYLDMDYLEVNEKLALKGFELYQAYGKGCGHPAQLNYGDCFAAALARERNLPLLYAGKDFAAAGF